MAIKLSSALLHVSPSHEKWRKTKAQNLIKLEINFEVKRKTFQFHMENGNSKMRMLFKIQAACHLDRYIDKVTFLCWGDVLRP